jgi:hypothetical protein
MLVVSRFRVDNEALFQLRAHAALEALSARPGYRGGRFGRAVDDPDWWCLVTEWESVGAYRRALSSFDVKITAMPLLAESVDEPGAFEVLLSAEPGGSVRSARSDRAADSTAPIRSQS